jgi:hypothetical protein
MATPRQSTRTNRPTRITDLEHVTPPSTLDPDVIHESDRTLGVGHGTDALGPSDTSDSGSDIHGEPGWYREVGIRGLETGTTSDPEQSSAGFTAGPDIGDANLDSDSDSGGTGEHATAARDTVVRDGQDIDTDHIEIVGEVDNETSDEDKTPTLSRERHRR